jgi:hypothetical protein
MFEDSLRRGQQKPPVAEPQRRFWRPVEQPAPHPPSEVSSRGPHRRQRSSGKPGTSDRRSGSGGPAGSSERRKGTGSRPESGRRPGTGFLLGVDSGGRRDFRDRASRRSTD